MLNINTLNETIFHVSVIFWVNLLYVLRNKNISLTASYVITNSRKNEHLNRRLDMQYSVLECKLI